MTNTEFDDRLANAREAVLIAALNVVAAERVTVVEHGHSESEAKALLASTNDGFEAAVQAYATGKALAAMGFNG